MYTNVLNQNVCTTLRCFSFSAIAWRAWRRKSLVRVARLRPSTYAWARACTYGHENFSGRQHKRVRQCYRRASIRTPTDTHLRAIAIDWQLKEPA